MRAPTGIRRVITVVLDGLRADAIPLYQLPHLTALMRESAWSLSARTVSPSITAAAMTSLLTGITPRFHGIESDAFGIPRAGPHLVPLPTLLQSEGISTHAYLTRPPRAFRGLGARIAERAGVDAHFAGDTADEVLLRALEDLHRLEDGYFLLHWPDADRAGHRSGWTSRDYQSRAGELDHTLGQLIRLSGVLEDPTTVLTVVADHGGGGVARQDHNSLHPLDLTVPLLIAGGVVAPGELLPNASLLDIPATVAWLFTGAVPPEYHGRALTEAFPLHQSLTALWR